MSDVFISYAHSTARQARAAADALKGLGYSVWLDDDLPAHTAFTHTIEEQLEKAKVALVIWSADAARSEWVLSEANRAREDRKLVQFTVDGTRLPMPFDQIHCADLSGWTGDADHPGWCKVLGSVADVVGGALPAPAPAPATAPAARVSPALPDKPSIAVLPFSNMSSDADQDYLADGIVESITAALSRVRQFFVIARASAFAYKGRRENVCEIGRQLGVAYVLEGSVQRAGNRIRISVQLVETEAGANVWTGRHDGTIDDIFDLQDQITEQVAGELQPSIRIAEIERSRRKRPQDLGAYDYAMRALPHVWALEKAESAKALALLDKALEIDPDYPLALSLAGWCHAQRSVYTWAADIEESQALALTLAERAAQLSGDDPLVLAVLGAVQTITHHLGAARVLLERALAIDPNSAWGWSRLGWIEVYCDRPKEAIETFERALRLSPLDPMNFNNYAGIGAAHEVAGDHDKAVAFVRRALEERPHAHWLYRHLACALSGAGRMDEARQAYADMMRAYPDLTVAKFKRAMPFSSAASERMAENLRRLGLPE
jgi:adenylate cyclase